MITVLAVAVLVAAVVAVPILGEYLASRSRRRAALAAYGDWVADRPQRTAEFEAQEAARDRQRREQWRRAGVGPYPDV